MPTPTQASRPFSVTSPLGPDVLLLLRMNGREELGRLFTYELELLSADHSISMSDLLGQSVTVKMATRMDGVRHFNGIVSRFSYVGSYGQYARYQATLKPAVWFLTRAANCRIAQGETSVDILKRILGDHGISDIDSAGIVVPPPREYCTQYRETDFDFVSRIIEHDGLYYYFLHEDGKHTLVLADGIGCHSTQPNYESLPWAPEGKLESFDDDRLLEWYVTQEVQTGVYSHTDYDFTKPKAKLETRGKISREHPSAEQEQYDYPGRYVETGIGETLAKIRIEEKQTLFEFAHGSGTARGVGCGALFSLTDHPRTDLDREYLIIAASYEFRNPEYETGMVVDVPSFTCHLTAVDARVQYRPARITTRPTVQGPQTARVTGPGAEPWTDEYGRVKVHFHWDRTGPTNEDSSCWVRVSQMSAGKNWGAMFLPHPGQEVIVDFLEGDPDQPIVIGRVYNADNMPPKSLPGLNRVSIIRDEFGNQITFDATPGAEHIRLSSPSHLSSLVLGQSQINITYSNKSVFTMGYVWTHTAGNSATYTIGNTFNYRKGLSCDVQLASSLAVQTGSKAEIFIGGKVNVQVGVEVNATAAVKYSFGWSRELNFNKAAYARVSKQDIKMDSEQEVWLCGGPKDSTIIKAGVNELTLTFGVGVDRPSVKDIAPLVGGILAGAGSLAMTVGQYWSQSSAQESRIQDAVKQWNLNVNDDEKTGLLNVDSEWEGVAPNILEGIGFLSTIGAAAAGVAGGDVADPKHATEKAKITINEHGVLVQSGNSKDFEKKPGVKLDAKANAIIWLEDSGVIKIISANSQDILVQSGGAATITLDAPDVIITGNLEVKKGFKQPNQENQK